jgi:hypothetical protein
MRSSPSKGHPIDPSAVARNLESTARNFLWVRGSRPDAFRLRSGSSRGLGVDGRRRRRRLVEDAVMNGE